MSNVDLRHGDCVELMKQMPDNSVDSIVTDPPYELGFMGKAWDGAGIAYSLEMWGEALRVLKPGGHLLAFGGTRTYHRMACAIEDAGFEIRDSIHWVYGSGFPKSLNISKAIDKAAGAKREVVGRAKGVVSNGGGRYNWHAEGTEGSGGEYDLTVASTNEAQQWEGWGTALKPAHEPVVVARKPLSGTVAANVLKFGTGGMNIDGCRVPSNDGYEKAWDRPVSTNIGADGQGNYISDGSQHTIDISANKPEGGRWPANIVFDEAASAALDQQSGETSYNPKGTYGIQRGDQSKDTPVAFAVRKDGDGVFGYGDRGGASRFFTQADWGAEDWPFIYQSKPSKKERNAGLGELEEKVKPYGNREIEDIPEDGDPLGSVNDRFTPKPAANYHPTVKPVALMSHLVRLVTPPNGTVLDPFAGSGTTLVAAVLEGFNAIGCEMTDEYLPIIRGRVEWAQNSKSEMPVPRAKAENVKADKEETSSPKTPTLF